MPYEILRDVEAHVKVHVEIPRCEVIVLEKLATYANAISRCAYPSIRTLAELTRYSVRSVQRILRELEKHGLIKACLKLSERRTVIYQILVPRRNSSKRNGDKLADNPHNYGKERTIFAHAHVPEEEIRQKTHDELEQLSAKSMTDRFRRWLGLSPTGAVQAIFDENAQTNLS